MLIENQTFITAEDQLIKSSLHFCVLSQQGSMRGLEIMDATQTDVLKKPPLTLHNLVIGRPPTRFLGQHLHYQAVVL